MRAERVFRPSRPSSSGAAAPRARLDVAHRAASAARRRGGVRASRPSAQQRRGALSRGACARETPAPTRALGWHRTPHMPAREAWPGGCSSASARGRAAAPRRAAFLCRPPRPYKAMQHGRLLHGRRSVGSAVPRLPPAPRPAERHFTGTLAGTRQRAYRMFSRRSGDTSTRPTHATGRPRTPSSMAASGAARTGDPALGRHGDAHERRRDLRWDPRQAAALAPP